MNQFLWKAVRCVLCALLIAGVSSCRRGVETDLREEVVFWHFWGGKDRDVVDDVVRRFNASQDKYVVRAIAMPGNNLDTKLFLSIAGGDPPDLVNQDDPIVGDWAYRGIISAFNDFVDAAELQSVNQSLFPAARKLGNFGGKTYAVANGLDVRAFIYNKTFLDEREIKAPQTLEEFNQLCRKISPPGKEPRDFYAYLPDSRRLWTWGYVYGGSFYSGDRVTLSDPRIQKALDWMKQFGQWYGPDQISAFRRGDQSLPGKTFPLLPVNDTDQHGRYIFALAGQWNTRDVTEFVNRRKQKNLPCPQFDVCPLPPPTQGKPNAGWVNGNIFVVPKGAKSKSGAWEFVKFWIGSTRPAEAAKTCAAGGWIPVSQSVVDQPNFQEFLAQNILFRRYVELAQSENQFTYPVMPGAAFFVRKVNSLTEDAILHPDEPIDSKIESTERQIQQQIEHIRKQYRRESP